MDAPTFDLQSHSTCSDGELSPAGVVRAAADAGVELLALTDHDTVGGVDDALAAARDAGVALIPAVELTIVDPAGEDLHVCGYGIDHDRRTLRDALAAFRDDRDVRAAAMATRLRDLGFALDDDLLATRRAARRPIGRPHLAQAVLGHRANAARLRRDGIGDVGDLIARYLIRDAPAFVPRTFPTAAEAVGLVHESGGVAVWAHPYWDLDDDAEVVATLERFAGAGIDGVEAFYLTHTAAQAGLLATEAARHGLLTTGSSDFHGPRNARFSRFRAFDLHGRDADLGPLGNVPFTTRSRAAADLSAV